MRPTATEHAASDLNRLSRDIRRCGPYRFVRHPGYVGMIIVTILTGPALGSLWALIPGCIGACGSILRTALEDATLQAELPGYREYARQVRFRLIPGLW